MAPRDAIPADRQALIALKKRLWEGIQCCRVTDTWRAPQDLYEDELELGHKIDEALRRASPKRYVVAFKNIPDDDLRLRWNLSWTKNSGRRGMPSNGKALRLLTPGAKFWQWSTLGCSSNPPPTHRWAAEMACWPIEDEQDHDDIRVGTLFQAVHVTWRSGGRFQIRRGGCAVELVKLDRVTGSKPVSRVVLKVLTNEVDAMCARAREIAKTKNRRRNDAKSVKVFGLTLRCKTQRTPAPRWSAAAGSLTFEIEKRGGEYKPNVWRGDRRGFDDGLFYPGTCVTLQEAVAELTARIELLVTDLRKAGAV